MKIPFPAIPYPHSGIQHTRALMALTAIMACLDVLAPAVKNTDLDPLIDEIRVLQKDCTAIIREKKLSAGARRDLDARFAVLGRAMQTEHMDDNARFDQWAANVWCALSLIESANITCPAFCRGRAWFNLQRVTTELATALVSMSPGADEAGTELYMEVA